MEIEGLLEKIIFRNEDNGYTVGLLLTDDGDITVVGHAPMIQEKLRYRLVGELTFHNRYGDQFSFQELNEVKPTKREAVVAYLSAGLISNVGKKTAEKIVDHFGPETLEVLERAPERLGEVEGIGKKRLATMVEALEDQREIREFLLYTANMDIPNHLALRIYKHYGRESREILQQNPYRLADEVRGIGFLRADEIARSLGIARDSEFRLLSGLKYALRQASLDGHTYLPLEELLARGEELLETPLGDPRDWFRKLALDPQIILRQGEGEVRVFDLRLYKAEDAIAHRLLEVKEVALPQALQGQLEEKIRKTAPMELAPEQVQAVFFGVTESVAVITGGPGTGKTTAINTMVALLEGQGLEVKLCAPTGRAAKRMQEATGREATTVHRLLKFRPTEEELELQEEEIEADVVIIDESSMLDVVLLKNLLEALPPGCRLIFVGDVDQLPSVGPGNVLRDLIDSEVLPVVRLSRVYRQGEESYITKNAHDINAGKLPEVNRPGGDFFLIRETDAQRSLEIIQDLVKTRLPDHYGFDPMEDIQVLSPMRRGICGVEQLNGALQAVLNPQQGPSLSWYGFDYRAGDKVMHIKNNYSLEWRAGDSSGRKGEGFFNGDMGTVLEVGEEELTVRYEGYKDVVYDRETLDELNPCYATTIHKAQGSEFPCVVIPLVPGPPMLLSRNLLYTAITRGKKLLVLVGSEAILQRMVNNNHLAHRYSALREMLVSYGRVNGGGSL
ncbi:MAG: ATP-dependent RecD-like DNA helicase [Tissierellia bacterium]|nr:ATP-dependent RecD-like DNA helicase [Tissierellia bacterium]